MPADKEPAPDNPQYLWNAAEGKYMYWDPMLNNWDQSAQSYDDWKGDQESSDITNRGNIDVSNQAGNLGAAGFKDPGGAGWFMDWLGAESEKWLQYTKGLKENLEGYASGVDVGTESAIAKQAESAEQRAMGGMGAAGNYFSGMRPAIRGAIQSQAGQALAESRSRTKGRGEAGLLNLGNQYAGLLGQGYGAGAGVYGSIYGRAPYSGMWQSQPQGGLQIGAPIPGQPPPQEGEQGY